MKKLILKAALLAATLALPMSANAVVYWDWSWSGNGTGSGSLTTDDLSGTSYLITDMMGIWNGANITGLLAPGSYGSNDNLLFDDLPQLTFNGVSFGTNVVSSSQVNLFWSEYLKNYAGVETQRNIRGGTFTATQVAPVPEPETYALMLAGLALVGAAARRRKAK